MVKNKKPVQKKPGNSAKQKTPSSQNSSRTYLYAALIAVLTFVVYSNSLQNDFVKNFDDIIYFSSADNVKALQEDDLREIFSSGVAGIYHPITILSLALETRLFGSNATHFHFFNLLFHIINVLLVFWFIRLLTKRNEIAVIVALFFGIHPMHVESVSWISERKDVLYTLFFLASLVSYVKYASESSKSKYLVYSLTFFLLSLLSKSAAVTLAPLIVLIDYYLKRNFNKKVILEKAPYFILALIFGIISIMTQESAGALSSVDQFYSGFSLIDRIFMVCYSIMFYIVMAVAPFGLSAIHYYPDNSSGMLPIVYYLSPVGIALIVFLIMKFKKTQKDLIFGFLFYLITIILVLQFIPVGYSLVSERYSYVPYIGLFFIAGKLYSDFTENKFGNFRKPARNFILLAMLVFGLVFSFITFQRNKVWKNDITLFSDVIEKNPEAGHAYWARGNGRYENKDFSGAVKDYNAAITNGYEFASIYNSRGKCFFEMDSLNLALNDYDKAILLDSALALTYYNRAHLKKLLLEYEASVSDYRKALEKNVQNPGFVYNEMSYSQFKMNDFENALISSEKAIELDPENADEYRQNKTRIENAIKLSETAEEK